MAAAADIDDVALLSPRHVAFVTPLILVHLACGLVFVVGASRVATAVALLTGAVQLFGITAGFHRLLAHRSFKTSRAFQFVLAFVAQTSAQRGALWWAAHHRNHHLYSDQPQDIHSPVQDGFWYSHVLWLFDTGVPATDYRNIPDLARYPELRFLNKYYLLPPILLGALVFLTLGASGLFFGFFVSTVLLWHGTFTINSLSHVFGGRRYATSDDSRNNWLLAIVTMGEGWHNNHHRFSSSTRQGFYWYEYDFTFYILKLLSWMGLVWQLRPVPVSIIQEGRRNEELHGAAGAPIAPYRGAVGTVGAEPG